MFSAADLICWSSRLQLTLIIGAALTGHFVANDKKASDDYLPNRVDGSPTTRAAFFKKGDYSITKIDSQDFPSDYSAFATLRTSTPVESIIKTHVNALDFQDDNEGDTPLQVKSLAVVLRQPLDPQCELPSALLTWNISISRARALQELGGVGTDSCEPAQHACDECKDI